MVNRSDHSSEMTEKQKKTLGLGETSAIARKSSENTISHLPNNVSIILGHLTFKSVYQLSWHWIGKSGTDLDVERKYEFAFECSRCPRNHKTGNERLRDVLKRNTRV